MRIKKQMTFFAAAACGLIWAAAAWATETVPAFGGSDSYVNIGTPVSLQLPSNSPFTIEGWAYFATLSGATGRDMLYSKSNGRTTGTGQYTYMFGVYETGRIAAYNGTAWVEPSPTVAVAAGEWVHLAYSFNGTTLAFYRNGLSVGSVGFSYTEKSTQTVKIGGYNTTSDINGNVSDVRVWNYSRSQAEIATDMEHRLTGLEAGLVGYWPLNEGSGTDIEDQTGNAATATLVGASWTTSTGLTLVAADAEFLPALPFSLADSETGSTRFTRTNTVTVNSFPVPVGHTNYQITASGDVSAIDPNGWTATNDLPETLTFDLPTADTNVVLYAWFTNTSKSITLRRSTADIVYTTASPVSSARATLSRELIPGYPVVIYPQEVDTGSHGGTTSGTTGGEAIPLHSLALRLTSGPDADATPGESTVSVAELGAYEVELIAINAAGNVATSSLCQVTVAAYGGGDFVWTGPAGGDWHHPLNWNLGVVPLADSTVRIETGASVSLTNATAALHEFIMNGTLTFRNWNTSLNADQVTINGKVTHAAQTDTIGNIRVYEDWTPDNRVWIVCSNLTVNTGKSIDVSGMGYAGGTKLSIYGKGPGGGKTISNMGGGGSYGGAGGGAEAAATYGSTVEPSDPGSGAAFAEGANNNANGGAGGGVIRIQAAGRVLLNGKLLANGSIASGSYTSGGSGGSIAVVCHTLAGTNLVIAADGRNYGKWLAGYTGYGGGGGRVSLIYDTAAQAALETPPSGTLSVADGHGERLGRHGEPGTLYVSDTAVVPGALRCGGFRWANPAIQSWEIDHLAIDNVWLLFPPGFSLTVTNDMTISGNPAADLKYRDMGRLDLEAGATATIGGNLVLTKPSLLYAYAAATNGAAPDFGGLLDIGGHLHIQANSVFYPYSDNTNGGSLLIRARTLTVDSGGQINADANGFAGGVAADGYGVGGGGRGTANAASSSGGGGGYGGHGGQYQTRGVGGVAYGLYKTPLQPGSGGGGRLGLSTAGGAGGGLIRIHTDEQLTINGILSANGANAAQANVGGGAGGGIYLTCRALAGDGTLRANGGAAGGTSGAGGGGRIAIWRSTNRPGMAITATAVAGTGSNQNGLENGTVYWSQPTGTVLYLR